MPPSTALHTDLYELTMVDAALASGVAERPAAFEVFARRLPAGRRYGVVAGTGRLLEAIAAFRFDGEALEYLAGLGLLSERALEWLASYSFAGEISGYREGELWFPGSPVLTVEAPFAEAVVLETLVLSILNFDSAVAASSARIREAAGARTLLEMGGRRIHEEAAVAAARAAYLAGFDATSNLAAGRRWGIPVMGTVAHAFILAHGDERAAFRAHAQAMGPGSTFLVDTYDTAAGIRAAVEEVGADGLGAVRLDSGNLAEETHRARRLLDELGATATRVVVSGDLDEDTIATLAGAPADAYGVGTSVVTGGGHPTAGLVYKLVAIDDGRGSMRPVAKRSPGKATRGGRKVGWRVLDEDGCAVEEVVAAPDHQPPDGARPLTVRLPLGQAPSLAAARRRHAEARAELPVAGRSLTPGPPALPVRFHDGSVPLA